MLTNFSDHYKIRGLFYVEYMNQLFAILSKFFIQRQIFFHIAAKHLSLSNRKQKITHVEVPEATRYVQCEDELKTFIPCIAKR